MDNRYKEKPLRQYDFLRDDKEERRRERDKERNEQIKKMTTDIFGNMKEETEWNDAPKKTPQEIEEIRVNNNKKRILESIKKVKN